MNYPNIKPQSSSSNSEYISSANSLYRSNTKKLLNENKKEKDETFSLYFLNGNIDRMKNTKPSNAKIHKLNTSIPKKTNEYESRSRSRKNNLNLMSKMMIGPNSHANKYEELIHNITAMNNNLSNLNKINLNIIPNDSISSRKRNDKTNPTAKKKINLSITNSKENLFSNNITKYDSNTKTMLSPKNSFSTSKQYGYSFVTNANNENILNDSLEVNDANTSDIKVKDKTIQIDSKNSLTDKIFPQLNTKSKMNFISKGSSRPFSSVMSATKSKTVNKGIQPLNSYFLPNMNYVYKSPSNVSKSRPFSHIQKSTAFEISNPIASVNFALSNRRIESDLSAAKVKKSNKSSSTLLSFDYNANIIKKKEDYLTKMARMDDTKFKKIMEMVDELELEKNKKEEKSRKSAANANNINNISNSSEINSFLKTSNSNLNTNPNIEVINSNKDNPSNTKNKKYNINYIKTNSINFGNININLTNTKNDSSPVLLSQRSKSTVTISIYILSSYNIYTNQIGLTEIELFDKNGDKIPIIEASASSSFENGDDINKNNNTKTIMNLFNGNCHTVLDDDMWTSPFYPDLKIDIIIEGTASIGSFVIWNYNGKDVNKGVKSVEIYRKNILMWKGQINKGCFNTKIDYSTKIKVSNYSSEDFDTKETIPPSTTYSVNRNKYYSARKAFYNSTNSLNSARNKFPLHTTNPFANSNSMNSTINNNFNISNSNVNSRFSSNYDTNINNNEINTSDYNSHNYSYEKNALRTSIGKSSRDIQSIDLSSNKKYNGKIITCNKIKIVITSNYGHRKFVGLTDVQFLDENGAPINIESASSIGALPKDVNTYYNDINDQRIFENVFNGITNTIDDSQMWLTVIKPNEPLPYFELFFDEPVNISAIRIYNYNSPLDLDKCAKQIDLYFDDHLPVCPLSISSIILHKGTGDPNVNYYQDITFPIKTKFEYSERELEPFKNVKTASFLYNQCYETPYLPSGFVFKFSMMSNYGDEVAIGIDQIELYDQLGRDLLKKYKSKYRIETNSEEIRSDFMDSTGCLLKYINTASKDGDYLKENSMYFFFKIPVAISYIKIKNFSENEECGVKDAKIYMDDKIIFEGALNRNKDTLILFTCDMEITKNIDENLLSKPVNKTNIDEIKTENYISMDMYL